MSVRRLVIFQVAVLLLSGAVQVAQANTMYAGIGGSLVGQQGNLTIVSQTTGLEVSVVGDVVTPGGLSGIDFNPFSHELYGSTVHGYQSYYELVHIDKGTGTPIGSLLPFMAGGVNISIGDLAFNPLNGVLYGLRSNSDGYGLGGQLYTIDTSTGAAALVGNTGIGVDGGIAFTATGRLYNINNHLWEINPNTAAVISSVAFSGVPSGAYLDALGFDPVSGTMYTSGGGAFSGGFGQLFTVTTGGYLSALPYATNGGEPSDITFDPVPEPGTLLLLGLGLVGLSAAWFGRRRKAAL